jgi:hypothetical protein
MHVPDLAFIESRNSTLTSSHQYLASVLVPGDV